MTDPSPPVVEPFTLAQLAAPRRRRRRTRWLVLGAAGVLLLGAGAVTYAATRPDPPGRTSAISPPSSTFTASGSLTLSRGAFSWNESPRVCSGMGGYDDVHGGTSITVTGADGVVLALGQLAAGEPVVDADNRASSCTFSFRISNVPRGKGFYGIEVSHRGIVRFTEAEMTGTIVDLTLG